MPISPTALPPFLGTWRPMVEAPRDGTQIFVTQARPNGRFYGVVMWVEVNLIYNLVPPGWLYQSPQGNIHFLDVAFDAWTPVLKGAT